MTERASGILMHISSLPSPYGIGTLGNAAYEYADFLRAAGQKYWQLLPIGPTSCGDSPYQSFSSYAGNPYFIDLDLLAEDGLLTREEIKAINWGNDETQTNYGLLYGKRFAVLRKAADRGWKRDSAEVAAFLEENPWLDPYAKFMALKAANGMRPWNEWEIKEYSAFGSLPEEYRLHVYAQYLFYKQWMALKAYVNGLGIKLIGDIPIYVPFDSADVWNEPRQFQLDSDNLPVVVSGVPPDYFSETGQLWGSPIYDYEYMAGDGFGWWKRRMAGHARLFDAIRIDHFRGFDEYWAIPYGSENAVNGEWRKGPGYELVGMFKEAFPETEFIAEDLGIQSVGLKKLLERSGFPGIRVLQFGVKDGKRSMHMPGNYPQNCVCYTGTHDNSCLAEYLDEASPGTLRRARRYFGRKGSLTDNIIRGGMNSAAVLFVAPMQDWLGLGRDGRMNIPQTLYGNWKWRMRQGAASAELGEKIRIMTEEAGR